jgi:multicomponent Na+:H+ antiporter subunit D
MLSSVIFLTAIAIIYGITGTLNMADVALKLPLVEHPHLVEVTAIFFLAGFGTKAAIFPFYFWLPSSYHTPPDAVSAVFGGLLTKLGVYAIIRVFSLLYADSALISEIISIAAGCTILAGGAAALVQNNIRKMFSYLIICHIGFMIAGVGFGSVIAITGVIFYLFHDIIVKTNLFMVAGLTYRITGTSSIRDLGGIYDKYPKMALLMAVPLFSLVGIPPLSGFWPKIGLITAGFTDHKWVVAGMIILGSFFTLIAIARLWAEVFWKPSKDIVVRQDFTFWDKFEPKRKLMYLIPIGFLASLSLFIGLGAGVIEPVAERIALELSDTMNYVNAVFKIEQLNN